MTRLTPRQLRKTNACLAEYLLFVGLFPDGVDVTPELCVQHADEFDWNWAAAHLLNWNNHNAYLEAIAPALKAYRAALAPVEATYDAAIATAQAAHDATIATARAAYRAAVDTAATAYDVVIATAEAAYRRIQAETFGRLYSNGMIDA